MTPTLEQRKAMALKEYADREAIGMRGDYSHETYATIVELLTPSPQAPESEVDEAIKYYSHVKDEKIQALIKAAQQPRQEWKLTPDIPPKVKKGFMRFHDIHMEYYMDVPLPSPPKGKSK